VLGSFDGFPTLCICCCGASLCEGLVVTSPSYRLPIPLLARDVGVGVCCTVLLIGLLTVNESSGF